MRLLPVPTQVFLSLGYLQVPSGQIQCPVRNTFLREAVSHFLTQNANKANVLWAETNARGQPVGDGCDNCVSGLLELYPELTWCQCCKRMQSDPEFRSECKGAVKMRLASAETFAGRQFHPDSEVLQDQATGQMTFLDVAVLTESDFTRIFKVSSKSLGYKKGAPSEFCERRRQESAGILRGLVGSLVASAWPCACASRCKYRCIF